MKNQSYNWVRFFSTQIIYYGSRDATLCGVGAVSETHGGKEERLIHRGWRSISTEEVTPTSATAIVIVPKINAATVLSPRSYTPCNSEKQSERTYPI